jgi:hypothetical protein
MLSYSYDRQHNNKAVYFQMPHLQSKVHLWNYVEIVQHSIENQKSALFRFSQKWRQDTPIRYTVTLDLNGFILNCHYFLGYKTI